MQQAIDSLPRSLYRAAGVRELDRVAIEEIGIPGFTLMRRAGRAALRSLQSHWPQAGRLAIFCGAGNNGGDGFIVAAEAARRGLAVELYVLAPRERLQGAALGALNLALEAGVEPQAYRDQPLVGVDVIVDALLGTGISGNVREQYQRAIAAINAAPEPVLAIDIPSGLCSDTGTVMGCAVVADQTLTFIGVKQGLLTGEGRACIGTLHFDDLGVPDEAFASVPAASVRLDRSDLLRAFPPRSRSAHKGSFGHVLVVGGGRGMGGAAALAARAAGRCGAGLVSLATCAEHIQGVMAQAPEVMSHPVASGQELEPLLDRPSVLVIGPGLGREPWGEQMLQKVWQSGKPLVVDADALNLLSQRRTIRQPYRQNWVMTPHPGEAAALLGCAVKDVQRDRMAAVTELHQRYGGVAILKGSGTLVADESAELALCPYGNPGMASGGMGDVLSGVIGALLAQGFYPGRAAKLGVLRHALAADGAAAGGERGLLASDLLPWLRRLVNPAAELATDPR